MLHVPRQLRTLFFVLAWVAFTTNLFAQGPPPPISGPTTLSSYVLFADGNHRSLSDSVRYGVQIGNNTSISRDDQSNTNIGSNFHIAVGRGNVIVSNLFSGNRIRVDAENTIGGNLVARNDAFVNYPVIRTGINGTNNRVGNFDPFTNIDPPPGGILQARGNILVSQNDSILGPIYVQKPYTYTGPPAYYGPGKYFDTLPLPTLPTLPFQATFPAFGTRDVQSGDTVGPGAYRDMILTGRGTITLTRPGVYIFRSVQNKGGRNTLNYLIPGGSPDNYKIYVHQDMDLGATDVLVNGHGPSFSDNGESFDEAARIYVEVHGTGSTVPNGSAVNIKDTSGGVEYSSFWVGTVYAPNGSIAIGRVNAPKNFYANVYGAFWSKTKILIGDNVRIGFQPIPFVPVIIDPYYPPPLQGKVNNKIGAELTQLNLNSNVITTVPDNIIFRIDQGTQKVWIEVIALNFNDVALYNYLVSQGFDSVSRAPNHLVITGKFPIAKLNLLNSRDDIDHVRPLYEPINNIGQTTTLGDLTMKSNFVRSQFGIEGNGVTVGVMSDSYNTLNDAAHDIQEGDLPANVQVARDFPTPRTDEGRAMLQIVHDVAPKANLVFRTGILSPLDFTVGIKEITLPPYSAKVIVDDITYLTEPFLKDGFVAQTVNDVVTNNGVTYVTSAGNFGSRSYESTFTPKTGATLPTGISGVAHDFGGGLIKQKLHLKRGIYTIVLQWDDNFYSLGNNPGAATDLDIFLLYPDGTYFGFNRDNRTADPIEVLPFNVNADTDADLMIVRGNGSANVKFKYIMFRGDGTIDGYPGSSTIVGQSNAEKAITVGAMLYANVNNLVPDFPSVASFSSRGGTTVNGTVRQKPDVVAPNGVNTTVTLSTDPITNIDAPDPFPNFFGTSAAAPHAAGVAALIIEAKKKFNLQPTVTPDEVKSLMDLTALHFEQPVPNVNSGFGLIQADEAILTFANAVPILNSLIPPPGITPANTTPFTLTVTGKYLNPQTQVYVRGAPIPTTFVSKEVVTAVVSGPISDDPPFQLYNPPKSPSGLDGGLSNALHLFSGRKTVTIRAENKTKKYGEALPAFTVDVSIDGVPLANTSETLASLKLDGNNISFTTFATENSKVGNYSITPSRTSNLNPANPTDAALLAKYDFLFLPGTLTIQRLPVKITPQNMTVTYGEFVGGVRYDYDFGGVNVSNSIRDSLDSSYKRILAGNTLIVVNGLPTPVPSVFLNTMKNMSTMASFQSVKNARKYLVQNGQLVPITASVPINRVQDQRFLVDISAQSLTGYKTDSSHVVLYSAPPEFKLRGLVGARALANGTAQAGTPFGLSQTLVNGQLLAMVNGPLQTIVNGQLLAVVNGVSQPVQDLVFQNGQLLAAVNGTWVPVTNGQIQAVVNGIAVTVNLSVQNGQLQAIVNGQLMAAVNGQLQAVVNGQLLAVVNGQLQAVVNGQLVPVINGQLLASVNGQLQAVVNGQLLAVVNGQLTIIDYAVLQNGQLLASVNGQLQAVVNGQLLAVVNGQLLSMVNGQLMAVVNGQVTFALLINGQLQAVVNGQLQAVVNGQLLAVVNGVLQNVQSYTITNGQLQAVVNGQPYTLVNGQLLAVVNGQLQAVVNNFGDISATNNSNAAVVIDRDDLTTQRGAVGGMFSVNMITGLNAGAQKLIPGTIYDPNFEFTYGMGDVTILPAPLTVDADWKVLNQGDPTPPQSFFTSTIKGLVYNDQPGMISGITYTVSPLYIGAPGLYIIKPRSNLLNQGNYRLVVFDTGRLYVNPFGNGAKQILVKAGCVRLLSPGEAAYYGYQYMASFTYNNRNSAPVYIPQGQDNFISIEGGGSFRNSFPEVFDPGVHEFYIPFSGQKMTWEVRSFEGSQKIASTGEISANGQKCQSMFSTQTQPAEQEQAEVVNTSVYPNPAHDKLQLHASAPIVLENGLAVVDASGRTFTGLPTKRVNETTLELTVSALRPGIYLVQVKTAEGYRTLRFTKL